MWTRLNGIINRECSVGWIDRPGKQTDVNSSGGQIEDQCMPDWVVHSVCCLLSIACNDLVYWLTIDLLDSTRFGHPASSHSPADVD